jgi:hypothetical protein
MKTLIQADRVRALLSQKPSEEKYNRLANFGARAKKQLTVDDVLDIRARWESGEKLASIAASHGCSMGCVSLIGTRQRRADVP